MKRGIVLTILFLMLLSNLSALRISPAKIEGNFKPGLEKEITFNVDSNLDRNLEIYVIGDLADYIEFDKYLLFKEGSFTAKIKLPETLEPPGKKMTYIGARELIDEELKGALATAVAVQAVFIIHVPYPGKYVESELKAHNVNIGEEITFELAAYGRGDEEVIIHPRIEILSEEGLVLNALYFSERELGKGDKIELKKEWNTTGFNAGRYTARSVIEYGGNKPSVDEEKFRIGELVVNIINHTEEVVRGEMKRFTIEIESGWNDIIEGAYANVLIYNKTTAVASFKTTPTQLTPWEKKNIYGYFNTSNVSIGEYSAQMRVYYFGEDSGSSSIKFGIIRIIKPSIELNQYMVLSIALGIALFISIILLIIKFRKIRYKNARKKK